MTAKWTNAIRGFAATIPPDVLNTIRGDSLVVDYVEPDRLVYPGGVQGSAPWHLDRIDQRQLPLDNTYSFGADGSGVFAYILDTGVQTDHPDFGGRAETSFDATGGNGVPCHPHGTEVAGVLGGSTYGVAKNVYLRSVRISSDCTTGTTQTSTIISGLNWVASYHRVPAVANLSFGGEPNSQSSAFNSAVTGVANSGVFIAVLAGNYSVDACNTSPGSASNAFTVAASDGSDSQASFSNFGQCVDLYAPGVGLTSDAPGSTIQQGLRGTSFATPAVAGAAALYKQKAGDASASAVRDWLLQNSTVGAIVNPSAGTPNRLLYTNFDVLAEITGPTSFSQEESGTYTAVVRFGTPPYSFAWYQDGTSVCSNSSSCTIYGYPSASAYRISLELDTSDATGALFRSYMDVTVTCPGGALTC